MKLVLREGHSEYMLIDMDFYIILLYSAYYRYIAFPIVMIAVAYMLPSKILACYGNAWMYICRYDIPDLNL